MKRIVTSLLAVCLMSFFGPAQAWHDLTHIAVGQAAGFDRAYHLAAPDIAKLKAYHVEDYNHWVNNEEGTTITPAMIKGQIQRYNLGIAGEERGHLYGAIVGATRGYRDDSGAGKYAVYHLVYAGHYTADLSMPLHNTPYDEFNMKHHSINDGVVEKEVAANLDRIRLYPVSIKTEEDLVVHIARIAQKAKDLGFRMRRENRDMTKEEAYQQLSDSASLFKGVLEYVNYQPPK